MHQLLLVSSSPSCSVAFLVRFILFSLCGLLGMAKSTIQQVLSFIVNSYYVWVFLPRSGNLFVFENPKGFSAYQSLGHILVSYIYHLIV